MTKPRRQLHRHPRTHILTDSQYRVLRAQDSHDSAPAEGVVVALLVMLVVGVVWAMVAGAA